MMMIGRQFYEGYACIFMEQWQGSIGRRRYAKHRQAWDLLYRRFLGVRPNSRGNEVSDSLISFSCIARDLNLRSSHNPLYFHQELSPALVITLFSLHPIRLHISWSRCNNGHYVLSFRCTKC